ncbi:hypothetical protein STEG23_035710, partial [Scotinomys teguina]
CFITLKYGHLCPLILSGDFLLDSDCGFLGEKVVISIDENGDQKGTSELSATGEVIMLTTLKVSQNEAGRLNCLKNKVAHSCIIKSQLTLSSISSDDGPHTGYRSSTDKERQGSGNLSVCASVLLGFVQSTTSPKSYLLRPNKISNISSDILENTLMSTMAVPIYILSTVCMGPHSRHPVNSMYGSNLHPVNSMYGSPFPTSCQQYVWVPIPDILTSTCLLFLILTILTGDAAGKVLDRWAIMSREEEIITLQQFLRFGETKSIVELMAIQEKEGQAVAVPSSKTDSDIRTFIESNNRTRSPSLLAHLENSNPSSIHHFENIPNSLAFLLPFQYINPVSAPLLGLPPNGLLLEQPGLRLREPSISTQNEYNESSESEVSPTPYKSDQTPNRNALTSITNVEPKTEPACVSPIQNSAPVSDLSKTEHPKSSFRIHRMRRMGSASRKGRVFCNACGKTFYDKGTLKIHYNAVHLKIKHRCTIEGCNMVFSSLRSRNRHSANPNPRLHMPMLRNNRDKDLIRATSGAATPVIASTKSNLTLTSPGRPPMGFTTPPLDPVLQNPLPSQLVFSGLKTVQPVPPFYRSLLTPGEMVSPPTSLPTSPIIPTSGTIEQHPPPPSEPIVPSVMMGTHEPSADLAPKKKPRKSSMPVKIEKEIIDTADEFDDEDDDPNDSGTVVNDMSHDNHCHSHEEMSPGMSVKDFSKHNRTRCISRTEIRRADSMTSEDQEPERDYENESESSEPKLGEESMEGDEHIHSEVSDKVLMNSERPDENHSEPSHQDVIKVKEEFTDPTYDMFYMSQYGLYNGGGASMAALHESFTSSLNYGSPQKFSPEGDLCSSPDPKICYVCKKSFKSSYSVKLHYRNVHLKEMHVCTVAGCNAAFPSRRSRD